MTRRCGCASDECSCVVVAGDGIIVTGAGSPRNPYLVTSTVAEIETGFDVQYNNVDVIKDVHQIDFRGTAVQVTPGTDEIVVTVNQPDPVSGYTVPTGAMWMFGGGTAPNGWLLCDGTTYLITAQPALFAVISNRFGGDGTTNFKVPDLRDRFPLGASTSRPIDPTTGHGGSPTQTLGAANMPPHTHDISHGHGSAGTSDAGNHDHNIQGSDSAGSNNQTVARGTGTWFLRAGPIQGAGVHSHSVAIPNFYGGSGSAGSGGAFDIMPPWLAVGFIIKA